MKIRVYSDVHNEIRRYFMKKQYTPWTPEELPDDKDTVLILAGDIDHGAKLDKYIHEFLAPKFKAVIHVAGNHEYYSSNMVSADRKMAEMTRDNVYHLNNNSCVIDGQKFVGAPMWTDASDPIVAVEAQMRMNDYKMIRLGGGTYKRITPTVTTALHFKTLKFFEEEVDEDTIVITHHNPLSPTNVLQGDGAYGYRSPRPLDHMYCASIEDFILERKPKAWISGHIHKVIDSKFFNTKFIVNCVGYYGEEGEYTDEPFEIGKI